MRTNRFTLLGLISLVILIIAGFIIYRSYAEKTPVKGDYECRAFFKLETPELTMPTVATFHVQGNKGAIWFNGPVYKNGIIVGSVSRRALFDFDDRCFCSKLQVTTMTRFSKDNLSQDLANTILPEFLAKSNSVVYFKIEEVENGTFFMKNNVPLFFCQNI